MQVIKVVKSFVLAFEGKIKEFAEGVHHVEENVASHWFVVAHSEAVAVETTVETEAHVAAIDVKTSEAAVVADVKTDEAKTVATLEAPVAAVEEKVEAAVAAVKKTK